MRLMDIRNYFNEYLRITRSCILTPDTFFSEIKDEEKRYLKPLAYGLISIGVNLIGCLLVYFFLSRYEFNEIDDIILVFSKVVLISGFFLIFILTPVARLFGGKRNFTQTFNVICYSVSVLNFSWIFVVLMLLITQLFRDTELIALLMFFLLALLLLDSFQYIIYLLIKGISITSEINKLRAFAAVIISFIIVIPLIFSGLYILDELSRRPPPYNPPKLPPDHDTRSYNLTVYPGSPPVIDGMISDEDRWSDGANVQVNARLKSYNITMKHDRENLYILMYWKGAPEWNDMISLCFEQDNGKADSNLNTGRVDWYYQSNNGDPNKFNDGHYESGYRSDQHQDGSLKVGYDINKSEWVQEWKIPMNSGDKDDIFIIKYPTVIGFSILNEIAGEGGILPSTANKIYPNT